MEASSTLVKSLKNYSKFFSNSFFRRMEDEIDNEHL